MPGQFDLQPNFPIAGVADLLASRPQKEAAMRAQQQQQLVEGLKMFGSGVQSLVDRRNSMAQALSGAQMYAQTPEGQQMLGNNQVASTPMGPVTQNQTASYNPETGTATPNQSPVDVNTIATSMYGMAPKDVFERPIQAQVARTAQGELALKQATEPQKIAIEGRKALAEEESARMQRLIQGLLANATVKNQIQERTQAAENAQLEANKETAKHFLLHPIAAYKANQAISAAGQGNVTNPSLPKVGETIVHPSGVKITRKK